MGPSLLLWLAGVLLDIGAEGQMSACGLQGVCCAEKTVGSVNYTLVMSNSDTASYGCNSNCIYEATEQNRTEQNPGQKFCFKNGDLPVTCLTNSTSEPMCGDELTWPNISNSQVCGDCKVVVSQMDTMYSSCDSYCEALGRLCTGAWKTNNNTCDDRNSETCDTDFGMTTEAICECKLNVDPGAMNMTNEKGNITNMDNMTNTAQTPGSESRQTTKYRCSENWWDASQYCLCEPGSRVRRMRSYHDNGKEDRRWTLTCEQIQPSNRPWSSRTPIYGSNWNWWDSPFHWVGVYTDAFMVGMQSYHHDHYEDRRFQVFYSRSDNWVLADCGGWMRLNGWDGLLDHQLAADEVFAEIYSHHSNYREDRLFYTKICRLVPRCNELIRVDYDYGSIKETTNDGVSAGRAVYDNRGSTSSNSVIVSISSSSQKSLSDTYTFSRTSGWSHTAGLTITASLEAGGTEFFPVKVGLSVAASLSTTFSQSSTLERSNTNTFSEENGQQITYQANCAARCYCVLDVFVKRGTGEIPYTMMSKSTGRKNPYSRTPTYCVEKGVLKYAKTFDARSTSNDQC